MTGKGLRKIIRHLLLILSFKKWIYVLPTFQNTTKIMRNISFINDSKQGRMTFPGGKKLLALLKGITSKHDGEFYFLNCLHWLRTKNKIELHKKLCKINIFLVSECLLKTLRFQSILERVQEFNLYWKSYMATTIIFVDLKSLIKNIDEYKNNIEKYSRWIFNTYNIDISGYRK